jgi:metallo-beta-lactamase family protein
MPSIHFLGAAGTVTGSRHLVEHGGRRILLDCGLFQGEKKVRSRNWDPFPAPVSSIDAVVLSHAHIDHTGWLPRLVSLGFSGPVLCTPATRDLCAIMLPDSGRLQEEEAAYVNRKGCTKHAPALPLYTEEQAKACLSLLEAVPYDTARDLGGGINLRFFRAGHILGSAVVRLELAGPNGGQSIVFSGDLGRYDTPILRDPEGLDEATTLLVECTYGDRRHDAESPRAQLAAMVREMCAARGVLLIPAFAIGRTQDLLYHLRQLQLAGEIPPSIPIVVDSPMATDATPLYLKHREEHDEEMVRLLADGAGPLTPHRLEFTRSVEQSKSVNGRRGPLIILSASGMATGGRVLHHLAHRLPEESTTVLFVGYQAAGTRGRRLLEGEPHVRIHGADVKVRARIRQIHGFSAHADYAEVDRWLGSVKRPPARTFCVHGEPEALAAERDRLTARGWKAFVPEFLERVEL